MKTLTFRQLLEMMQGYVKEHPGKLDMQVIVRVQGEDDLLVGGLVSLTIDPGCTEVDALVLDGSTEAED